MTIEKSSKVDEHSYATKKALSEHFDGSMTGFDIEKIAYLKLKELGFTDENTLFSESSCPDEVNHDNPTEDITAMFALRWGEVFPLGGLAGFPFTGKTGWGAFSSHVPKNGNIAVLYAPHVGIDKDGNVGKVSREG
jgi:hypothetical protein